MNLHKQLGMDPNNKKTNYMKLLEKELSEITEKGIKPRLLLHSCCAPCSSYVLEYLREFFEITVFYYNPNITANEEYDFRLSEEKRLIEEYNRQVEEQDFTGMHSTQNAEKIGILEAPYDPERYLEAVKGLEDCPEGGDRCGVCFAMRLEETAKAAAEGGYDFFTTTLTISPLKNAARLNEIGSMTGAKYGVPFLPSDFKKKNGYKRSIELSEQFGLYRQNYCGCSFSVRDGGRSAQGDNTK